MTHSKVLAVRGKERAERLVTLLRSYFGTVAEFDSYPRELLGLYTGHAITVSAKGKKTVNHANNVLMAIEHVLDHPES